MKPAGIGLRPTGTEARATAERKGPQRLTLSFGVVKILDHGAEDIERLPSEASFQGYLSRKPLRDPHPLPDFGRGVFGAIPLAFAASVKIDTLGGLNEGKVTDSRLPSTIRLARGLGTGFIDWRPEWYGVYEGQVDRSGKQTMGLFLGINGWSENVPKLLKQNPDKSIVLMDGFDLRTVLAQRLDLSDFLLAKVARLNFEAEPFLSVKECLVGEGAT